MSNIKDICCNPRLQDLVLAEWLPCCMCDVVRHCRWAQAPVIHAVSHFDREKRVAWVSISMYTCPPVPIVMGLRLAFGPPELRYKLNQRNENELTECPLCTPE